MDDAAAPNLPSQFARAATKPISAPIIIPLRPVWLTSLSNLSRTNLPHPTSGSNGLMTDRPLNANHGWEADVGTPQLQPSSRRNSEMITAVTISTAPGREYPRFRSSDSPTVDRADAPIPIFAPAAIRVARFVARDTR